VLASRLRDYRTRFHTKYLASVIFVHINKTGGSSIEKALKLPFQHRTAVEILDLIGRRRWEARFSFAFIRNPWDKVASHYHYRVKTNQTGLRDHPVPFNEWVRLAYGEKAPPYYDNPKMFMPQVDWVADSNGEILVEFIGRFESLHTDFAQVCEQIGWHVALPHLKQSERGNYQRYYASETVDIVARCFQKDIQTFGYRFD
jgi:chondroitin 4-sulfotransferase 11